MYDEDRFYNQTNDLQLAFETSRMEIKIHNDTNKIKELVEQGKHVIVSSSTIFCPRTDAYLGSTTNIEKVFDTIGEAENAFKFYPQELDEINFWIEPSKKNEPQTTIPIHPIEDCPF